MLLTLVRVQQATAKRASAMLQELCVVKQTDMIVMIRKDNRKTMKKLIAGTTLD